ncbi:hypothetical protein KUTG_09947 [Kutzneria sp. 744]|nr:hypothetical protein KUTG_09947 [Kutzneria sp. 744]
MNATLETVSKTEARRRYENGQHIGVTNDRPTGHVAGYTFTKQDMNGITFAELVTRSTDSCRPSAVFWLRPTLGEAESLLGNLSPADLVCAVRTLGELHRLGAVDLHAEHPSSYQSEVAAKASEATETDG